MLHKSFMVKIVWLERKTKEEVLEQIKRRRIIWEHKGNILRKEGLVKIIFEGKVEGRKSTSSIQYIK